MNKQDRGIRLAEERKSKKEKKRKETPLPSGLDTRLTWVRGIERFQGTCTCLLLYLKFGWRSLHHSHHNSVINIIQYDQVEAQPH